MPGWTNLRELVGEELAQAVQEGKDSAAVAALRGEWESAGDHEETLNALFERLQALPVRDDFGFEEPSDLEGIRGLRNGQSRRWELALSDDELFDKLHGAWLGRCAGCALGKPVESFLFSQDGMASWQRLKTYLTAVSPDEWPLRDYIPEHSPAKEQTGGLWSHHSTREHIAFMESDDDIRYTVLGQQVLRAFGPQFTSSQVALMWLTALPYNSVCTAETQAYRNMVWRTEELRDWTAVSNPEKARQLDGALDWHWITHYLNPYREWIGAQIRVDAYGYAAPGDPALAAEFAWRDARISHVKNGIYGAMFCAAMIAAAFATDDPLEIIEAGLAEIPTTSRLYAEMRQIIALCEKHGRDFANFEAVIEDLYALLGHYSAVHTNNNAAICIASLLLCGNEWDKGVAFGKAITFAVMAGWDTDCNGATVGSVVGAITGARQAPPHWTARLNDTLKSNIIDYHPIPISQCARYSVEIARTVERDAAVRNTAT